MEDYRQGLPRCLKILRTCLCEIKVELLSELAHGPGSVSDLAHRLSLDVTRVSAHLVALRDLDIVRYERHGNTHCYDLTPGTVVETLDETVRLELRVGNRRLGFSIEPVGSRAST